MTTPKIIIFIGFQASTKSTVAKEIHQNNPNVSVVSRDQTGGKVDTLIPQVEKLISEGRIVIIDNTNLTRLSRKVFIDIGKKYKVPVEAHYFKTTIEDCQIRHLKRMYDNFGEIYQTGTSTKHKKDPHCFGSVVLFKARKDLEMPTKDEGFKHIIMREVPPISWDNNIFKNKALFLDIDGTIRATEHLPNKYPTRPDEVQLLHSAERMRATLEEYRKQDFKLIGISNQSGISKEIVTEKQVDEIFEKTRSLLGYTSEEFPIIYCPHRAAPITCFCRKPQSGMAIEAIMKLKLNPKECIMVGDMKTDEEMAKRLNIKYFNVDKFW